MFLDMLWTDIDSDCKFRNRQFDFGDFSTANSHDERFRGNRGTGNVDERDAQLGDPGTQFTAGDNVLLSKHKRSIHTRPPDLSTTIHAPLVLAPKPDHEDESARQLNSWQDVHRSRRTSAMCSESGLSGGSSIIWLRSSGTDSAATYDGRCIATVCAGAGFGVLAGVGAVRGRGQANRMSTRIKKEGFYPSRHVIRALSKPGFIGVRCTTDDTIPLLILQVNALSVVYRNVKNSLPLLGNKCITSVHSDPHSGTVSIPDETPW